MSTDSVRSSMTLCFSLISSRRRASCLWWRPRWVSPCWRDLSCSNRAETPISTSCHPHRPVSIPLEAHFMDRMTTSKVAKALVHLDVSFLHLALLPILLLDQRVIWCGERERERERGGGEERVNEKDICKKRGVCVCKERICIYVCVWVCVYCGVYVFVCVPVCVCV